MQPQSVTAVIIGARAMFEHDRRLWVFSEELGKVSVLIKYAQKTKSGFCGAMEPFNVVNMILKKGRSFYYTYRCDMIEPFYQIRCDWGRLRMAAYGCDLIMKSTTLAQPNPGLFYCLVSYLRGLHKGESIDTLKMTFYQRFLQEEGLLNSSKPVSEAQFQRLFYQYSGHWVSLPELKPELLCHKSH